MKTDTGLIHKYSHCILAWLLENDGFPETIHHTVGTMSVQFFARNY